MAECDSTIDVTVRMKRLSSEDFFSHRDHQFSDVCSQAFEIFREKNRQYNDAISRTGLLGACVEIVGVAARLEPLVIKDAFFEQSFTHPDNPSKASILNSLHDLHNYATIALMMIEDENWRGR